MKIVMITRPSPVMKRGERIFPATWIDMSSVSIMCISSDVQVDRSISIWQAEGNDSAIWGDVVASMDFAALLQNRS